MFESSLVNDKARTARPYTVSLSLMLQITAAAAAVAYPLWHIEALLVIPLRAPSPFRRAVELVDPKPAQPRQPAATTYRRPIFNLASLRPRTSSVTTPTLESLDVPVIDQGDPAATGPFLPEFFRTGNETVRAVAPRQPAVKTVAPRPAVTQTGPVRVGGNVRPPLLIHEVKPGYPKIAVMARIQGTVKIEAVIARDGTIRDARVVSGPPLLVAAALDAVRQWRYRATILNDEAVEVALALDVNFTLAR